MSPQLGTVERVEHNGTHQHQFHRRSFVMEVHVNYLAVFVAALANYIIATVWYAVVFGSLWKKLTGISDMKPVPMNMVIVFVGSLVMSYVLVHSIVFGNSYVG